MIAITHDRLGAVDEVFIFERPDDPNDTSPSVKAFLSVDGENVARVSNYHGGLVLERWQDHWPRSNERSWEIETAEVVEGVEFIGVPPGVYELDELREAISRAVDEVVP